MMDFRGLAKTSIVGFRRLVKLLSRLDRESIVSQYIRGNGLEVGALHNPVRVPKSVNVCYVDRMTAAELRTHYPELASRTLVPVDIIDNGETLATIPDASQDFVIANHFLEHCQNPIGALKNMFRVVKAGGIVYLALPDKRFTFDANRPVTSFDHLLRDFTEGPSWSRKEHFLEWAALVEKQSGEEAVALRAKELMQQDYSIHYHVWTQEAMFDFLLNLKRTCGFTFDVEAFLQNEGECIFVLRKAGAFKRP
jgi:SAM-dependent methyltransferase